MFAGCLLSKFRLVQPFVPPYLPRLPQHFPAPQRKFAQFHSALRSRGICLTDQICHRKAFRNPDFLQKLVEHFGVQQHGSAFPPEVFDPGALPAEDTAGGVGSKGIAICDRP